MIDMSTKKGQVRKTARRAYAPKKSKPVSRHVKNLPRFFESWSDDYAKYMLKIRKK